MGSSVMISLPVIPISPPSLVQMFNANGEFLLKWGTGGSRPGEFNRPAGLAVNTRNEVIVADKDNHRVQVILMEYAQIACRDLFAYL